MGMRMRCLRWMTRDCCLNRGAAGAVALHSVEVVNAVKVQVELNKSLQRS